MYAKILYIIIFCWNTPIYTIRRETRECCTFLATSKPDRKVLWHDEWCSRYNNNLFWCNEEFSSFENYNQSSILLTANVYMHVFGVINHHRRGQQQHKDDVCLYTWLVCDNRKDSHMITSAWRHAFNTNWSNNLADNQELRLFSDSCYVQSKNISVLTMLFALRKQNQPHLDIIYFFPIRGHSLFPADRVFGRIQQDIKKRDQLLLLIEYVDILQKHNKVWAAFHPQESENNNCVSVAKNANVLKLIDKIGVSDEVL